MNTQGRNDTIKLMVLEGDGIGPEITAAILKVLGAIKQRFGLDLVFDKRPIGVAALTDC